MTPKARRRRIIIWCVDMILATIFIALVMVGMMWAAGYFTAQAAPVLSEALWAAYHAIMG